MTPVIICYFVGEVASLCDACSELIHVGFLEEHDVQPIALKVCLSTIVVSTLYKYTPNQG